MWDKELEQKIIEFGENNLTKKRWHHSQRVAQLALKMARQFGAKEDVCYIGALAHDIGKAFSGDKYIAEINKYNLGSYYENSKNLGHSKLGVKMAGELFGLNDSEILNTISYHTTGRANMTTEEKIVFLADAIEPERKYLGVDKIRKAYNNKGLDQACLIAIENTIGFLKKAGINHIDKDTILARDWLKEGKKNEHKR